MTKSNFVATEGQPFQTRFFDEKIACKLPYLIYEV